MWVSTEHGWPGNRYKPAKGYTTQEFVVIYHHGDKEMMTNIAFWDGRRFVIGGTCQCNECGCGCDYQGRYSKECHVTHWMPIEIPGFGMSIYLGEG